MLSIQGEMYVFILFSPLFSNLIYIRTGTSIRKCPFVGPSYIPEPNSDDAHREVFETTLGFYCAILSRGCYGLCHDMDNDNIFEDSTLDLPLDSGAVIEDTC